MMSKMAGITVTGISRITVPETVGVSTRRNSERRSDRTIWNSAAAATSVASNGGPPSATAVMQTAMKAPELPIMSTWPMPMRPSRTVCITVAAPQIKVAANTAQAR